MASLHKDSLDSPTKRLQRWERGETPGPWYVTFMPTLRCNLRCAICWQRAYDVDHSAEMTDRRLLELVDECADLGARSWIISGGGEPFVRREALVQVCERIRAREMNGILVTNGMVFSADGFRRLFDAGWWRIGVSLDGPDSATNDAIRSSGSFEHAVATLRRLVELRRGRDAAETELFVSSVITASNYRKLPEMVTFVHELGCDGIALSPLQDHGPSTATFSLLKVERAAVEVELERARARAEALGLEHNIQEPTERHDQRNETGPVPGDPARSPATLLRALCFEPWLSLTIHADGRIGPCCLVCNEEGANVREAPVAEVWRGPYLEAFRRHVLAGDVPAICAQCPADIRARTTAMRVRLEWAHLGAAARLRVLAGKAASSWRRYGLRAALRRGTQWRRLMKS